MNKRQITAAIIVQVDGLVESSVELLFPDFSAAPFTFEFSIFDYTFGIRFGSEEIIGRCHTLYCMDGTNNTKFGLHRVTIIYFN